MPMEDSREVKKQQMLECCLELFVKQGLENTSLNDLTAYCNTYKAAFYNYFESKDDIVIESAKLYMDELKYKLQNELHRPPKTLCEALKKGFDLFKKDKNFLRYIYQVISSPKYGENCRAQLTEIYTQYTDLSVKLAKTYNVDHETLRPYYLLYVGTINDYCLWENEKLVEEKLAYIYRRIEEIEKA